MYKIVSIRDDKKWSSNDLYNKYVIEYIPNEWVYPTIGKIYLYKELDLAIHVLNTSFCCLPKEIWKCETIGNYSAEMIYKSHINKEVENYWNDPVKYTITAKIIDNNAMCADAVKLTKLEYMRLA